MTVRHCKTWQIGSALLLLLPSLVLAQSHCTDLDPRVRQLLQAMASGAANLSFSGVATLQRGGDMQIVEIKHSVTGNSEQEQLTRLTGQDAMVSRPPHPLDCVHPGHQLLKSGLADADGVCSLAAHYRFQIAPGESIAGREAIRLRAEPLDMYRFGHIFDLDRESALMLRSMILGADQRVIEQYQLASIDMTPTGQEAGSSASNTPESSAIVRYRAAHPHPAESAHLRRGIPWGVDWVPAGFVATDAVPDDSARKTYTDGLSSFSVFLEVLARPLKSGEGVERQGSTVAYTRGMSVGQHPVLVTVLGEVPTNTARMVADSVTLRR